MVICLGFVEIENPSWVAWKIWLRWDQNAETLGLFSVHSQADLRSVSRASWKKITLHKHGSAVVDNDCEACDSVGAWRKVFPQDDLKELHKMKCFYSKRLGPFPRGFWFRGVFVSGHPATCTAASWKPKLLQLLLAHSRMRRWQDQRVTSWDRCSFVRVTMKAQHG